MTFSPLDRFTQPWDIGISYGDDLTFCLYVRDRFRLEPAMTPRIPALVPQVPQFPAAPENRRLDLEAEWIRWWQDRLRARREGQRRHLGEPADAFPEIESPELLDAARIVSSDGHAWASARKQEFIKIFEATRGQPGTVQDTVARYATAYPFKLSVSCLPVNDKRGWRITHDHALASYQLYADWPSFLDWLAQVISNPTA